MSPVADEPGCGSIEESEAELLRTLKGHVAAVTSLAFSPSALLLVSGCCKGWMNVWALQVNFNQSINQSINVKSVGRRYTTRPGAPTVVSGKHDHKVHS